MELGAVGKKENSRRLQSARYVPERLNDQPPLQTDKRFNRYIQLYGCAFMSCCWLGGVNTISGCTSLYNKAIQRKLINEALAPT